MYKTTYDKSKCQTGIVHIGYGVFHRAHQAMLSMTIWRKPVIFGGE